MSPRPRDESLASLPEPGRQAVLAAASPRTWAAGELLTRDGDRAASLMVLTAGRVLVRLGTGDGNQVALAVLGTGDVLGEVGVLSRGRERTADAVALTETTALVLTWTDFDRVRRQTPQVDDFVMELMARRIDRLSHRLAEARHVPVGTRVARRLHEVARPDAGDGTMHVPLNQEDLAGLAGTTRQTANTVLRRLENEGVVRLGRGRVEILDPRGLRERCADPTDGPARRPRGPGHESPGRTVGGSG